MTGKSAIRALLEKLWWAGVSKVKGDVAVSDALTGVDVTAFTHVLAIGKAATPMARAALSKCPSVTACLILAKYGHGEDWVADDERVTFHESDHPVPDEASLASGALAIDFVSQIPPDGSLLLLLSGGGSALVESLPAGMDLGALKALTNEMLASGLDIHAMNAKRKDISLVKGGKLLSRSTAQGVKVLAISDVSGDDIRVIASGIGAAPDTGISGHYDVEIIASNAIARAAAEEAALAEDIEVIVNAENLYGDLKDVAKNCSQTVRQGAPGLYIFGGEPTTVLPDNPGEGGRNQALAVAMAQAISGVPEIGVLVAGTDGSDGPTRHAGGFVTGEDWSLFPGGEAALADADSAEWLRRTGGLFVTGPTGTNVMDLMLVIKN